MAAARPPTTCRPAIVTFDPRDTPSSQAPRPHRRRIERMRSGLRSGLQSASLRTCKSPDSGAFPPTRPLGLLPEYSRGRSLESRAATRGDLPRPPEKQASRAFGRPHCGTIPSAPDRQLSTVPSFQPNSVTMSSLFYQIGSSVFRALDQVLGMAVDQNRHERLPLGYGRGRRTGREEFRRASSQPFEAIVLKDGGSSGARFDLRPKEMGAGIAASPHCAERRICRCS